jgi:hypothetical protein
MKVFTLNLVTIILLYILATGLTWYLNTTLGIIVGVMSIISLCYINISASIAKSKLKEHEKQNEETV